MFLYNCSSSRWPRPPLHSRDRVGRSSFACNHSLVPRPGACRRGTRPATKGQVPRLLNNSISYVPYTFTLCLLGSVGIYGTGNPVHLPNPNPCPTCPLTNPNFQCHVFQLIPLLWSVLSWCVILHGPSTERFTSESVQVSCLVRLSERKLIWKK